MQALFKSLDCVAFVQGQNFTDKYIEVIGTVVDSMTVKAMQVIDMGEELGGYPLFSVSLYPISYILIDLKLVDQVVELTHDPRFATKLFSAGQA